MQEKKGNWLKLRVKIDLHETRIYANSTNSSGLYTLSPTYEEKITLYLLFYIHSPVDYIYIYIYIYSIFFIFLSHLNIFFFYLLLLIHMQRQRQGGWWGPRPLLPFYNPPTPPSSSFLQFCLPPSPFLYFLIN